MSLQVLPERMKPIIVNLNAPVTRQRDPQTEPPRAKKGKIAIRLDGQRLQSNWSARLQTGAESSDRWLWFERPFFSGPPIRLELGTREIVERAGGFVAAYPRLACFDLGSRPEGSAFMMISR